MKLIELAKDYEAKIITNDFNLNKVAQLQGVEVLNINELANALKPIVLPGEAMRVFILKEGKEYNQGVAYLDDGTMVVVDNARKMIGKTIDVAVTSVSADHRRQDDLRQVRRARRFDGATGASGNRRVRAEGGQPDAGGRSEPSGGNGASAGIAIFTAEDAEIFRVTLPELCAWRPLW